MNILLVLSEYAISSSSDDPITRKWPKNLACAYLDHSKRHFWWILNNPTRVITWTSHGDYLVQSEYMQYQANPMHRSQENDQKQFLAVWIIQKGIFEVLEWSITTDTIAKSCRPFGSIMICNIKSIRCTELVKSQKPNLWLF